jgi:hypothetical protein
MKSIINIVRVLEGNWCLDQYIYMEDRACMMNNYISISQSQAGIARTSQFSVCICHTRFSEENQMHLICAPGSSLHTYDGRHE